MLTFKNITVRDAAMLRRYYENCDYALCEYSAGVKLMWRSALRYAWAEAAGCLIIRCESEGRVSFDYPVAGPDGDEDAALSAIEAYCMETGIQPEISIVPEEKAPALLARYPYVRVSNIRIPYLAGLPVLQGGPPALRRAAILRPAESHQKVLRPMAQCGVPAHQRQGGCRGY